MTSYLRQKFDHVKFLRHGKPQKIACSGNGSVARSVQVGLVQQPAKLQIFPPHKNMKDFDKKPFLIFSIVLDSMQK